MINKTMIIIIIRPSSITGFCSSSFPKMSKCSLFFSVSWHHFPTIPLTLPTIIRYLSTFLLKVVPCTLVVHLYLALLIYPSSFSLPDYVIFRRVCVTFDASVKRRRKILHPPKIYNKKGVLCVCMSGILPKIYLKK